MTESMPKTQAPFLPLNTKDGSKKATLVVLSGPSGVGKGTMLKALETGHNTYGAGYFDSPWPYFASTVSATTRRPRQGEKNGVDYYFLDVPTFKAQIQAGDFLEYKPSGSGDWYGTLASEVERIHALGKLPVLEIETEGKKEIEKLTAHFKVVSIFIAPPPTLDEALVEPLRDQIKSHPEDRDDLRPLEEALTCSDDAVRKHLFTLAQRLDLRNSETSSQRLKRLSKAVLELKEIPFYDVVIVNDTLASSVPRLRAVFEAIFPTA
ncbi:MAG: hypothetical protein HEQ32_07050 [Vampirovibrio sp.]